MAMETETYRTQLELLIKECEKRGWNPAGQFTVSEAAELTRLHRTTMYQAGRYEAMGFVNARTTLAKIARCLSQEASRTRPRQRKGA